MQFDTSSGLFTWCEWLYRLAYINIIAIFFTLMGGVIAGICPAITAMFALNNKWLNGEDDFAVFPEFWKSFKAYFLKSNLLGGLILLTAIALTIDFSLANQFTGVLYYIILSSSSTVIVLSLLSVLYVFSLMIVFPKDSLWQLIKKAIQMSMLYPLLTMWMILSMCGFFFICWVFSSLAFLFLGSGLSFIAMSFSHVVYKRMKNINISSAHVSIPKKRGVMYE
nr:DUF624 domain-containing protein [Gracilibacillus halophilus]